MLLITGDGTWKFHSTERDDISEADLRKAYRPIKAFLTKHKLECEFAEPGLDAAAERARIEHAEMRLAMQRRAESALLWLLNDTDPEQQPDLHAALTTAHDLFSLV